MTVLSHERQAHSGAHLDRPDTLDRERYSISDLTREFDCTARALRFYEDEGLVAPARESADPRLLQARSCAARLDHAREERRLFAWLRFKEMIDLV